MEREKLEFKTIWVFFLLCSILLTISAGFIDLVTFISIRRGIISTLPSSSTESDTAVISIFIWLMLFNLLTIYCWLHSFKKVVITEKGIRIHVYNAIPSKYEYLEFVWFLHPSELFYPYGEITKIKIKKFLVVIRHVIPKRNIRVIIFDSKSFALAIEKYAPDKLEAE